MLKQPTCTCNGCHNVLKTFQEVALGICEDHRNLLTSKGHYGGVCWNCGIITGVYEVPRRLDRILTEKYLFSKGCSKCSNEQDADVSWITIKKHTSDSRWAIDERGKLTEVRSEQNTISVTNPPQIN